MHLKKPLIVSKKYKKMNQKCKNYKEKSHKRTYHLET